MNEKVDIFGVFGGTFLDFHTDSHQLFIGKPRSHFTTATSMVLFLFYYYFFRYDMNAASSALSKLENKDFQGIKP